MTRIIAAAALTCQPALADSDAAIRGVTELKVALGVARDASPEVKACFNRIIAGAHPDSVPRPLAALQRCATAPRP